MTKIYENKNSSEILSCLKEGILTALSACSSVKPHISKCACPNVHDGVHGQDRLLMAGMSNDRNAWHMTACKQKPNMVIAMVTYPCFIQPENMKKDTTGSFRGGNLFLLAVTQIRAANDKNTQAPTCCGNAETLSHSELLWILARHGPALNASLLL